VIRVLTRPVLLIALIDAAVLMVVATGHSGSETLTFVLLGLCGLVMIPLVIVTRRRKLRSRHFR